MCNYKIEEIPSSYGNALLARGAFGEVRIGLKVNNDFGTKIRIELVAIKSIRNSIHRPNNINNWGFSQPSGNDAGESDDYQLTREAFSELASLRVLQPHENIVPLLDIMDNSSHELKLVFPYSSLDLSHILQSGKNGYYNYENRIPETIIRVWGKDILKALAHCHSNDIIHGDVKPSNFLLCNKSGRLQLCDFGLAQLEQTTGSNNGLCTLHYRPPELLLGSTSVTMAVDLWSCACVIGEIYNLQPIFPGRNVIDQLTRIFQQVGFSSSENWYTQLPDSNKIRFHDFPTKPLAIVIPRVNSDSNLYELLSAMLSCDSTQRPTAEECLEHSYFFLPTNVQHCTIPVHDMNHNNNVNLDYLDIEDAKHYAIQIAKQRRSI